MKIETVGKYDVGGMRANGSVWVGYAVYRESGQTTRWVYMGPGDMPLITGSVPNYVTWAILKLVGDPMLHGAPKIEENGVNDFFQTSTGN